MFTVHWLPAGLGLEKQHAQAKSYMEQDYYIQMGRKYKRGP
jgi:hypothetical protein